MKNKKPSFYYFFGATITIISLIIMIVFLFLPMAMKDGPEYINYISLGMVILGLVTFLFGYFLLKKANFITKNKSQEEINKKFEDELFRATHQDEIDKIKSRELEDKLKKDK